MLALTSGRSPDSSHCALDRMLLSYCRRGERFSGHVCARHGAWHGTWAWDLLRPELEAREHRMLAPDLPCEDPDAGVAEHAAVVRESLDGARDAIVVGHSLGATTIPLMPRLGDRRSDRDPVSRGLEVEADLPQRECAPAQARDSDSLDCGDRRRCRPCSDRPELDRVPPARRAALAHRSDPLLRRRDDPRVPRVIRHSLNLESGLNDGLASQPAHPTAQHR